MKSEYLGRIALWALLVISIVIIPPSLSIGKMGPVEQISCKDQISRVSVIFDGVRKSFEMPPPEEMPNGDELPSPYIKNKNLEGKAGYIVEKIYKGIIPDRVEVVFPARQNSPFTSYRWSPPPMEGIVALNIKEGIFEIVAFHYSCKEELLTLGKLHEALDSKISQNPNDMTPYLDKIKLYEDYKDFANAVRMYENALQRFPDLKSDEEFLRLSQMSQKKEICETRIRRMGKYFYGNRKKDELAAFRTACMNEDPPK